jgi:hypothetical protein
VQGEVRSVLGRTSSRVELLAVPATRSGNTFLIWILNHRIGYESSAKPFLPRNRERTQRGCTSPLPIIPSVPARSVPDALRRASPRRGRLLPTAWRFQTKGEEAILGAFPALERRRNLAAVVDRSACAPVRPVVRSPVSGPSAWPNHRASLGRKRGAVE